MREEAETASECFLWMRHRGTTPPPTVGEHMTALECDAQRAHFNIFHQETYVPAPKDFKKEGIRSLQTILGSGVLPKTFLSAYGENGGGDEATTEAKPHRPMKRRIDVSAAWRKRELELEELVATQCRQSAAELKKRQKLREQRKAFLSHLKEVASKRPENRIPTRRPQTARTPRIQSKNDKFWMYSDYPLYQDKALCNECTAGGNEFPKPLKPQLPFSKQHTPGSPPPPKLTAAKLPKRPTTAAAAPPIPHPPPPQPSPPTHSKPSDSDVKVVAPRPPPLKLPQQPPNASSAFHNPSPPRSGGHSATTSGHRSHREIQRLYKKFFDSN